jgi:hypothetical protein
MPKPNADGSFPGQAVKPVCLYVPLVTNHPLDTKAGIKPAKRGFRHLPSKAKIICRVHGGEGSSASQISVKI